LQKKYTSWWIQLICQGKKKHLWLLQALPTSKFLIVIASYNLHKGFCNEKDDPNLPDFNPEKKRSKQWVRSRMSLAQWVYVCIFRTCKHNLILQENLLWMTTCHSFQTDKVTTLGIGNVRDNMGALNLPCFFEGKVNLSIHTNKVNCPIFTNRFQ